MSQHLRSVMWQRLDLPGSDFCTLSRTAAGWRLAGVAVAIFDGTPLRADYVVECDESWHTRETMLSVDTNGAKRQLHIVAAGDGVWTANGQAVDGVRDSIDVDLNVTPATNTLSLRRLNLAIGASAEVVAAWVRFPELTVEPLWQRYTRLSEERYGYESDGGFTSELIADDLGLVIAYRGLFMRVSA